MNEAMDNAAAFLLVFSLPPASTDTLRGILWTDPMSNDLKVQSFFDGFEKIQR